jgi:hypothetical protein
MVVYGAGKERIFVYICSAVHLSYFVAFSESRFVAWRQIYVVYFNLKQTCSESFKQSKPSVYPSYESLATPILTHLKVV